MVSVDKREGHTISHYPFSRLAKAYLEKEGVDISKVSDDDLQLAIERVKATLTKKNRELWSFDAEAKSYALAKILVALLGDFYVKKQFAKGEANRAFNYLMSEKEEIFDEIASQFFDYEKKGGSYSISFIDYLNNAPNSENFHLINQELRKGKVYLHKSNMAALISEKLYNNIINTQLKKSDFPKKFVEASKQLQVFRRFEEEISGPVELSAFPPCMRKIYLDLQTKPNVPHNARFVFATFLANIKMDIDQAVKLFSKQENFSEQKTRYHLEHAYGTRTGRKYAVPSCSKIQSYGLCYKNESCKWASPITYYKNMLRRRRWKT
ncbi:hypothetical protein DRN74_01995 [Candidatus Micrarchaeota archaeon]|nr:MAG: hypothetical protein DRN74_01995 [Candidatus Micrarchaeota archaeon]